MGGWAGVWVGVCVCTWVGGCVCTWVGVGQPVYWPALMSTRQATRPYVIRTMIYPPRPPPVYTFLNGHAAVRLYTQIVPNARAATRHPDAREARAASLL